ncbi:hypothetical protein M408DRAFT_282267 [Serendipita vermifera MAFF 305830]|uniref:Thioester reductase (TE) domain-containing protein n=1 Tax=Serendipita vermifera MAFF 305830 TaxID=933852 RepID=A0A0C3ARI4_SERVB|nr:hypothetical protein M408DRAFT_282267 [Serendipita vermifera MAFF 305830]
MTARPNVLVFGGLEFLVRALTQHLIPPLPTEPLVAHIRVIDKYSINPPTTMISKELLGVLRDRADVIEYRQGNLANPTVVTKSFTDPAPNGLPYNYVVDATGDVIPERPPEVYARTIFEVSVLIARASAAQLSRVPGSIQAHIRYAAPFYEPPDLKRRYKETDHDGWKPRGTRGVWWHETTRAVASVPGLPLVVLRTGLLYGEMYSRYEAAGFILLGLVYKHLGEDMRLLWSPELPKSSLNVYDFAGAIWKAAQWMSTKTRDEAEALAGAAIPPSYDPSVTSSIAPDAVPASAGPVFAPVFNLADEGDTTQGRLGAVLSGLYGVKVRFQALSDEVFSGMKLNEIVEEANLVHLEAWNEMITRSKPPVPNTPLSPYMPLSLVEEHGYAIDGERSRKILGYQYRYPQLNEQAVCDYIDWCRREGAWPETGLYIAP